SASGRVTAGDYPPAVRADRGEPHVVLRAECGAPSGLVPVQQQGRAPSRHGHHAAVRAGAGSHGKAVARVGDEKSRWSYPQDGRTGRVDTIGPNENALVPARHPTAGLLILRDAGSPIRPDGSGCTATRVEENRSSRVCSRQSHGSQFLTAHHIKEGQRVLPTRSERASVRVQDGSRE